MASHYPSCGRMGCGPAVVACRRLWWAPWRVRRRVVCWVCETPLDPGEERAADERFGWMKDDLGRRVAGDRS